MQAKRRVGWQGRATLGLLREEEEGWRKGRGGRTRGVRSPCVSSFAFPLLFSPFSPRKKVTRKLTSFLLFRMTSRISRRGGGSRTGLLRGLTSCVPPLLLLFSLTRTLQLLFAWSRKTDAWVGVLVEFARARQNKHVEEVRPPFSHALPVQPSLKDAVADPAAFSCPMSRSKCATSSSYRSLSSARSRWRT